MDGQITDHDTGSMANLSFPRLVVRLEGQVVQEVVLREDLRIGRAKDNDLHLPDARVARHHARVVREGSRYRISDLDSAAGTWINGIRLIGSHLLRGGERIAIGGAELIFHEPDDEGNEALDDLDLPSLPARVEGWQASHRRRLVARIVAGLLLIAALAASAFFFLGPDAFAPAGLEGSASPSPLPVGSTPDKATPLAAGTPRPTASPHNPAEFEGLLDQAQALYGQSRFDEAIAIYRDLAQQAPDDARPEIGWAWALILAGRSDQALEHARRAVGLDPLNADTMIVLARAYLAVGDYVPALGMAQNAMELDGQNAEALAVLAEALLRRGQLQQAVEAAASALAQDPQSAEAHRVRGWLYEDVEGDLARAVAEFQAAADLQPDLWLRQYDLGCSQSLAGEYEVAIVTLNRALGLWPDPAVYTALGEAYYGAGQLDQVSSFLNQALEAGAADAQTYALLALVQAQAGQCGEARSRYEQALQLEPTNPLALEAKNRCEGPTPTPAPTASATEPPPTPEAVSLSGRIAFPVWNGTLGTYDTYLANADGSGRSLVVQQMHQPAFRPDGQWLAVNGDRPNQMNLFIVRPDGSDLVEITEYVEDGLPAWSPEGGQLVFSSTRHGDGNSRLYVVDPVPYSGERVAGRLLVSDLYELLGQNPAWMPSVEIVYAGCDYLDTPVVCGLFAISAEAGPQAPRQITSDPSDTAPAALGRQVAFMSNRDGNWEIYVVASDGSGLRRLTDNPANDGLPTWSPDGKALAFVSDRGGAWAVWVVNADGTGVHKLFDIGGGGLAQDWQNEQISWAP
jgi:TolB protein